MIPKKLHIVWIGDAGQMPVEQIQSWRNFHPDWDITVWDNARVQQRSWRHGARMAELGHRDVRGTVELMRFEILHDEGGVAVDADSFCVAQLPAELLQHDAFSCWVDERLQPGIVSTSFMGASARNPSLALLLHELAEEVLDDSASLEDCVGTGRFSRLWARRGFADIAVYPSHYFLAAERAAAGIDTDKVVCALHARTNVRRAAAESANQAAANLAQADLERLRVIIFSKDRPLQLDATLTSLYARCAEPELLDVRVLAAASDGTMRQRYACVEAEHPRITVVAESDFRANLCELVDGARLIALVCDDALFVRAFSVTCLARMLREHADAIGISLRLGENIRDCYPLDRPQPLPKLDDLGQDWRACDWSHATLDFAYPLELSSSVYRAGDMAPLLRTLPYRSPNELEERLAAIAPTLTQRQPILILPRQSVAFCAPLNVVQSTHPNRHGGRAEYSAQALATIFDTGSRVDVEALRNYTPAACHTEIDLPLRERVPAVSVVVRCYRQADTLSLTVVSVIAQGYKNWELIVVNDGSPDDTSAVVTSFASRYPNCKIRLLEQSNAGLVHALNSGVHAARGRYILPLDADDAITPDFLARTVAILEGDPNTDIVHTDVAIFGAGAGVWCTGRPFDVEHLRQDNGLAYASVYRREVWSLTGGYRATMSAGYEDWDFWLGAAAAGFTARHLAEPLLLYRQKDSGSMLGQARRHDAALRAQMALNHPARLDADSLAAARRTLADHPLPPHRLATTAAEIDLSVAKAATQVHATKPGKSSPGSHEDARLELPSAPPDPLASLRTLREAGVWRDGQPLRLHLGCGEQHASGYVNVDLAPDSGSLMRTRADVFGDVVQLRFPDGVVDEVRSHHMFEHFPRVQALGLLIRWHEWLCEGGRLVIETPDIEGSARTLLSDQPLAIKMGIVRHLAGDQAERWGFHVDHWFPQRFVHTLERLGFSSVQIESQRWPQPPYLSNVVASGVKALSLSRQVLLERADELLGQSLVATAEHAMLARWRAQLREFLAGAEGIRRDMLVASMTSQAVAAGTAHAQQHEQPRYAGRRSPVPACGVDVAELPAAAGSFERGTAMPVEH